MTPQKLRKRKVSLDVKQKIPAVIKFLLLEGRDREEITIRLHDAYGEAAYSRATVFRWINRVRTGDAGLQPEKPAGRRPGHEIDPQIQDIIRDHPFASSQMIAEMLSLSPETLRFQLLSRYVLHDAHRPPNLGAHPTAQRCHRR
jgi:transposase